MITIHKYELDLVDEQIIKLPKEATVVKVAKQNDNFFIWAMVDTSLPFEDVKIAIISTGNPVSYNPIDLYHIDTIQDNEFVWHVFFVLED